MLEQKRLAIPTILEFSLDPDNKGMTFSIIKRVQQHQISKHVTVNKDDFDKFELYRVLQIFFEFLKQFFEKNFDEELYSN